MTQTTTNTHTFNTYGEWTYLPPRNKNMFLLSLGSLITTIHTIPATRLMLQSFYQKNWTWIKFRVIPKIESFCSIFIETALTISYFNTLSSWLNKPSDCATMIVSTFERLGSIETLTRSTLKVIYIANQTLEYRQTFPTFNPRLQNIFFLSKITSIAFDTIFIYHKLFYNQLSISDNWHQLELERILNTPYLRSSIVVTNLQHHCNYVRNNNKQLSLEGLLRSNPKQAIAAIRSEVYFLLFENLLQLSMMFTPTYSLQNRIWNYCVVNCFSRITRSIFAPVLLPSDLINRIENKKNQ
jgi:hypothetical protein